MSRAIIILAMLGLAPSLWGQRSPWYDLVKAGADYSTIQAAAYAHFDTAGTGRGSGYKQFMRWSLEAATHAGARGERINYMAANMRGVAKAQRMLSSDQGRSTHGEWVSLGPSDYSPSDGSGSALGRTCRIAVHPSDPSTFLLGTPAGGLWKSVDAGASWAPQTDGLPTPGISAICYNYLNPSIIYLLTGDNSTGDSPSIGVLKSTDGGTTWNSSGLSWTQDEVVYPSDMVIHPVDPSILIVGTSKGVWRTVDGGANWTKTAVTPVWDLEIAPDDPNIMYATSDSTLLKSFNAGGTWAVKSDPGFPPSDTLFSRMYIAVSPSAPSTVYALFGGKTGVDSTFYGLFKSSDYGENFSLQSDTPNILGWEIDGGDTGDQAWRGNGQLVVEPLDDDVIYVGGINIWKSTDGGVTWQLNTDWRPSTPSVPWIHADQTDLQFINGWLYACNDGGLYRTTNGGADWTDLSSGLSLRQYYQIDVVDNNYIAGSQDNGTNLQNVSEQQASMLAGGDGFGSVFHTGNTGIKYFSTIDDKYRKGSVGVLTNITPPGENDFWNDAMEMHTGNPDYLYVAHFELYRGNGGVLASSWNWIPLNTTFSDTSWTITTITQAIDDPQVMYISNRKEILKTLNVDGPGTSWAPVTEPSGPTRNIEDIAVDPANWQRIWIAYSGYQDGEKVYFSPDSGNTWQNVTGSLPNVPMHCLLYQPGSSDGIYVGTDIGIFYRNNTIGDWIYFSNGLPTVVVKDMDFDNGYLYAGTYGRGLWRTPIYTTCPGDLVLTQANDPSISLSTGTQVYHAANTITTSRVIAGGLGSEVYYNAGNYVSMIEGFWTKPGNIMQAKIEGCPE